MTIGKGGLAGAKCCLSRVALPALGVMLQQGIGQHALTYATQNPRVDPTVANFGYRTKVLYISE